MYRVSSSPHIRNIEDSRSIMLDVIIALIPALAVSVFVFGMKALLLVCVSVASAVFFEWLYRKAMKKEQSISDLSAVITGMLLAYCMPSTAPLWLPVVGTAFSIIVVKQLFGGIGKNFMNPALAGRAFLFSWPVLMSTWAVPLYSGDSVFNIGVDAVTGATPLAIIQNGEIPGYTVLDMFLGRVGGSLGEVSAFALLLGGAYLVIRKVISPRIPLSYLLTVAVITLIAPQNGIGNLDWMLYNLFGGGVMLGAIFMATDYATSPVTPKGQIIFGVGCGLITLLIRYFGAYNEGVTYAILIMNVLVWMIDKHTMPRRFGVSPEEAKALKKKLKEEKKNSKEVAG